MKILNFKLIIVQSLFLFGQIITYAQSTSGTNTWVAGRYLGYDALSGTNPLLFRTNNLNRMKLNSTVSYPVNGYAGVRDGDLLIGQSIGGNYTSNTEGAASLLHLNGRIFSTGTMAFLGHRPWMQTGITMTDNDDLSYFGLRQVNGLIDLTETTITWSNDNDIPGDVGPDDMVFGFTNGVATSGSSTDPAAQYNTDLRDNLHIDGRHFARFSGV